MRKRLSPSQTGLKGGQKRHPRTAHFSVSLMMSLHFRIENCRKRRKGGTWSYLTLWAGVGAKRSSRMNYSVQYEVGQTDCDVPLMSAEPRDKLMRNQDMLPLSVSESRIGLAHLIFIDST